jgi:hypothetical protein
VKRPERNTSVFNWGGTAGTLSPEKGRCFFYFSVPETSASYESNELEEMYHV